MATGDSWSSLMLQTALDRALYPRAPGALEEVARLLMTLEPFPTPVAPGEGTLHQLVLPKARALLGGCQAGEELEYLRERRLMDCSWAGQEAFQVPCITTCGNRFASIYFSLYLCISNFVLINLLLAVLMKQLQQLNRDTLTVSFINDKLPKHTFVRAVEVWRSFVTSIVLLSCC